MGRQTAPQRSVASFSFASRNGIYGCALAVARLCGLVDLAGSIGAFLRHIFEAYS